MAGPSAAAVLAGVALASIWGAFLSVPAFKLSGPFLSICTVAFGEVVRLLTINLVSLTNGPYGFYGIPSLILFGRRIGSEKAWYFLLWSLLVFAILAAARLKRSYIGRALAAIREDETAAEVMGDQRAGHEDTSLRLRRLLCRAGRGSLRPHVRVPIARELHSVNSPSACLA